MAKRFKYDLLQIKPPLGYRFIKTGETISLDDFWWLEKYKDQYDRFDIPIRSFLVEGNPIYIDYLNCWGAYVKKL